MEQLGSHLTDFHHILYLNIIWKSVEKIQVSLKYGKNNRYFTRRQIYIFGLISPDLRMRNVSGKSCRENQKTLFTFNTFFRKSCRLCDHVKKFCRAGQATEDSIAHVLNTSGYKYIQYVTLIAFPLQQWLHECNTLYVHCLSCFL